MQTETLPCNFSIVEIFGDLHVSNFREVIEAKYLLEQVEERIGGKELEADSTENSSVAFGCRGKKRNG